MTLQLLAFLVLLVVQDRNLPTGVRHWQDGQVLRLDDRWTRFLLSGSSTDFAHMSVGALRLYPGRPQFADGEPGGLEELIIVKEGRLRVAIYGQETVLGPGSVALLLGNEPGHRVTAENDCTFYTFLYRSAHPRRADATPRSFVVPWDSVPFVPSDIGGRRQIADRPTGEFGRLEMHVSTLNGGLTNHPVHTHAAEEFVVVLRGSVRMVIGDTRQEAGLGDVIFLGSNVPHSLDNIGTTPAEYFAFQWMQP